MPAPAYYRGRPARFWIAITSGPAGAAAGQAAASPASPHPAVIITPPMAAWAAWAANWFAPDVAGQGRLPRGEGCQHE